MVSFSPAAPGVTASHHDATDILGVHVSAANLPAAATMIEEWIDAGERRYACFCTVHTIMECQRDPELRAAVNRAGLRAPDGMPLVWLSRLAGHRDVGRVYGPDMMLALCERSAETGHTHFFYGGAPSVADELARRLKQRFHGLRIAGIHEPPMLAVGEQESAETIARINAANPDIIWVGLGTPKQDWWLATHRPLLNAPVLIAIGAAFDFHSGRVHQAPVWMQRTGFEWLFRLTQDPRRLWKRYVLYNAWFLARLLKTGVRSTSGD